MKKSPSKDYTVEAVYVVPCKKCKSYLKIGNELYICGKTYGLCRPKPDDFCSYGERREE